MRELLGEWQKPWIISAANSRIYLVEDAYHCSPNEGESRGERAEGRRVFVLSLDGATLQVYDTSINDEIVVHMCMFERMLSSGESALVYVSARDTDDYEPHHTLGILKGA